MTQYTRKALTRIVASSCILFGALCTTNSIAQEMGWKPSKPIQIMIGATPGGVPDVLARGLGAHLQNELGQSVIVENKPGANGTIALNAVKASAADGHTMIITYLGPYGLNPAYIPAPNDTNGGEGFVPAGLLAIGGSVVVTAASNPWGDLSEFSRFVKNNPSENYTFGSPGANTILRLYGEMIADKIGKKATHISYKGVVPVALDVANGNLTYAVLTIPAAMPLVKSGKLRVLAKASTVTNEEFKSVKTLQQLGFGEVDTQAWYAAWVSEGTPKPAVAALNRSINSYLNSGAYKDMMERTGMNAAAAASPEQIQSRLQSEMRVWRATVQKLGLKLEN